MSSRVRTAENLSTHGTNQRRSSLADFCRGRNLSVDSRLAITEQICELVSAAHRRHVVFEKISSAKIMVEYVDGGLVFDLGHQRNSQPLEGSMRVVPHFSADAMRRAVNVFELGTLLTEITAGELEALSPQVDFILLRAMSTDVIRRYTSADDLLGDVRKLRAVVSQDKSDASSLMRWSWA